MKKENSDNGNAPKDTPKRKYTSKQVAAIIGIALLAMLYIPDSCHSGQLFYGCLVSGKPICHNGAAISDLDLCVDVWQAHGKAHCRRSAFPFRGTRCGGILLCPGNGYR